MFLGVPKRAVELSESVSSSLVQNKITYDNENRGGIVTKQPWDGNPSTV